MLQELDDESENQGLKMNKSKTKGEKGIAPYKSHDFSVSL